MVDKDPDPTIRLGLDLKLPLIEQRKRSDNEGCLPRWVGGPVLHHEGDPSVKKKEKVKNILGEWQAILTSGQSVGAQSKGHQPQ